MPIAYPGFPQLKLFPESAALLDGDPFRLQRVHPKLEKPHRRVIGGFVADPVPLRQVLVLQDADADAIAPMPPRQGFMELVRHTYLLGFLNATESSVSHFRQAISLASRVPVARLLRRRSLDALGGIVQLVEGTLERAA